MKMEQIECSETSAYNNQTPGKYPKEYIHDSKHGESLKSRIFTLCLRTRTFTIETGSIFLLASKLVCLICGRLTLIDVMYKSLVLTPQKTHWCSITKTNRPVLFKRVIITYCEVYVECTAWSNV